MLVLLNRVGQNDELHRWYESLLELSPLKYLIFISLEDNNDFLNITLGVTWEIKMFVVACLYM